MSGHQSDERTTETPAPVTPLFKFASPMATARVRRRRDLLMFIAAFLGLALVIWGVSFVRQRAYYLNHTYRTGDATVSGAIAAVTPAETGTVVTVDAQVGSTVHADRPSSRYDARTASACA